MVISHPIKDYTLGFQTLSVWKYLDPTKPTQKTKPQYLEDYTDSNSSKYPILLMEEILHHLGYQKTL